MPLITYQTFNFRPRTLEMIKKANAIIEEYQAQGFDLTLRQIFYQFVSRGFIPNTQREYKNLGGIINDARLAGLIDWNAVVDRTRNIRSSPHWDSPASIVQACAEQFRFDLWETQDNYVEVWIEKDALIGVIENVCQRFDVPHFSCRGYTSQSELWGAAQRLIERAEGGKRELHILHLGDHDPSGMDMTRDTQDRMTMFGADVRVDRLALNTDQVRQYNPPPNPAKTTDSRARDYIANFGRESWELDALDPKVIASLIEKAIRSRLDPKRWNVALERQKAARKTLTGVSENWEKVTASLNGGTDA